MGARADDVAPGTAAVVEPRLAAMLHEVFLASPDPIIVTEANGRCLAANPAALDLLGVSPDDLPSLSLAAILHPYPVDAGATGLGSAQRPWQGRATLTAAGGTAQPVEIRVAPLSGEAAGLHVWYPRLVPEPAPAAPPASEAEFRALVEQLPAVVYLMAADQSRIYYSPYLKTLAGYDPEEALAILDELTWLDFVHPEDHARIAAEDTRTTDAATPFRAEYRALCADGSYVWVRDECVPIFDDDGILIAWHGFLTDITDRIAAEETQSRLAAVVESAEDAIITTRDNQITSWNQGAERMYGYSAEEAIGQPITLIMPDGVPEAALAEAWRSDTWPLSLETTRQRRDGSRFDVAVTLSAIRDRNAMTVGVSSVTRDVSDRKRAETALQEALAAAQEATRTKSRFLATMTHELRTPLQAVLGYAEFLLAARDASLTPDQREDIGYIHQGAQRMAALIDDLLDLSRMDAGRLELAKEPVDLRAVIEQVRQDVTPLAAARGLALTISLPSRMHPALGDAGRVRQILLNLAGNAVKFTDEGAIVIEAESQTGEVAVRVRDSGIGIAPEDMPLIFDEFQQVGHGPVRRPGAGLGLPISQRLAEQMGGRITVSSAPGVGSTFTLWLPAAPVSVGASTAGAADLQATG